MITKKQIWQSIYHIIKYSDYELAYINDEESDIILENKNKKELIRFISEKQNVQSLTFLIDKMKDNLDVFNSQLNYIPQKIHLLLLDQEVPGIANDRLVKVKSIHTQRDLDHLTISMPYRVLAGRFKSKPMSQETYRSKVIKNNFIDLAMVKFAPATLLLIVINVIVYLFTFITGRMQNGSHLIDRGGLTHFNFVHGDYYRVITSMFLHFDFSHLIFNMMTLFIFGKLIEYLFGVQRYLLIYFTGGLIGNLISLSFDTTSISAGASGAISGLLGALVAYFIFSSKFERKFIIQTILGMIIYLLITNVFAQVNNFAHFGGLFGGFLTALLIYVFNKNRNYFYMLLVGTIIIITLLLMNIFSQQQNHIYNMQAHKAMEQGNFKQAATILQDTFDNGYENEETYLLSGLVSAHESNVTEAMSVWKKGLKKFPNSPSLNYQMALGMRATDNYSKARTYLHKAMEQENNAAFKRLDDEIKVFDN